METIQRTRRERPKVVTLTEAAAARVREIMGRAEKPYAGLRVGVKNGGCAGQEYVLEYAEAADPLDEIVERRICPEFEVKTEDAVRDAEELAADLAKHGILLISEQPITSSNASAPEVKK